MYSTTVLLLQQEGAAVEGAPAMGLSLQLSTCALTDGTTVAMTMRSPGARRQGILTPAAKYQVDRTTGGEVMGIFRQQRN